MLRTRLADGFHPGDWHRHDLPDETIDGYRLAPSRIGLFQPWVPSMDEGWTRLVLEKFGFKYTTLHNADICAGSLKERVDVLLIPSIEPKTLRDGYAENETEPAYVGGLGSDGAEALRAFLKAGGTLVCLADSTRLRHRGAEPSRQERPQGAENLGVLRPWLDSPCRRERTLAAGPRAFPASSRSTSTARRPSRSRSRPGRRGRPRSSSATRRERPLESGWLLGPEKIEGKAALVDGTIARGPCPPLRFPPPAPRPAPRHLPAPVQRLAPGEFGAGIAAGTSVGPGD